MKGWIDTLQWQSSIDVPKLNPKSNSVIYGVSSIAYTVSDVQGATPPCLEIAFGTASVTKAELRKGAGVGPEPSLISEHLVSLFKFWMDGRVQDGMRCNSGLFHLHQAFDSDRREQVFALAWAFSEHNIPVVITSSGLEYKLWISLRSREQSQPSPGSADVDVNRAFLQHDLALKNSYDLKQVHLMRVTP